MPAVAGTAKVAVSSGRAAAAATDPDCRRPREWHRLARLVAARFAGDPRARAQYPWRRLRATATYAATWLLLAGGLGWTDAAARAVVLAVPGGLRPPLRLVGVVALVAAGLGALVAAAGTPELAVAVGVVAAVAVPPAVEVLAHPGSWAARRRLRRGRPAGRHAHLGSLASAGAGAGFALLERLCARADAAGEVLCLNTAGPWLIGRYEERGFAVEARAALPWGTAVTMVRRPSGR